MVCHPRAKKRIGSPSFDSSSPLSSVACRCFGSFFSANPSVLLGTSIALEKRFRACLDVVQNHGLEKTSGVMFLKPQKDYDYDGTTVFKTIKLVHPNTYEFLKTKMFCKTVVFI